MCTLLICALLLGIPLQVVLSANAPKTPILVPHSDIKNRKFQTLFIAELNELVDTAAGDHLNGLLQELRANKDYATYATKIESAASSKELVTKIVYLKQLLDIKLNVHEPHNIENFYTLRNLNFLSKLKHQLLALQEDSATELRHLRWYNLCRQFWFRDGLNETTATTAAHRATSPPQNAHYWSNVKLAPLRAEAVATKATTPPMAHIDLERFASTLYANVKAAGAEIIDDYLLTVRKLLQEVVEEKHLASSEEEEAAAGSIADDSHVLHASKLAKVLTEIDAILATDDFYAKRNRLYSYLENDLSSDYEQFKSSQYAPEDLADILAKLQSKGVDLFVTFIFSNFEFIEHLHETWAKLLPWPSAANEKQQLQYDAASQRLFDVHRLYLEFKGDGENNERYEAYQGVVKALYADTRNASDSMPIFELLNNASANVGTVTLNMIKAKCDEF
ncbi:PREDICTED: uncharacterized protein LOC108366823 [Rhagoletis zephyria]|uniref:uncharacterized protein LOC108366823 n=1 Tax=Rhagoletis zephyria TaxID=28612 RepID=UPI000811759A|nr:PREDICTED: uncharacterized protein LOC108366823 [Rhagoletis zephyria]XP_017476797.1 PREDICTED: uncharacterized protein LOC108366823 [Rhagoletis zephyria]